jgi:hypothetical protein
VRLPESSSISPSVRDALAIIHRHALELIVQDASLDTVLDALCDGIDALDPDLISSVLLADPDGQRLWPKAGRRVPEDWKQFITPLPIGPCVGACGTAAFRKARVINQDIATDPLWSGPAEKYRVVALQHGFRSTWSVPLLSKDAQVLGTFGLYHTKANAVRADEIEVVEQAGNIALLAIERHRAQAALTGEHRRVHSQDGSSGGSDRGRGAPANNPRPNHHSARRVDENRPKAAREGRDRNHGRRLRRPHAEQAHVGASDGSGGRWLGHRRHGVRA